MIAGARTFFATSKTSQGRCLLQSQRSAELLIDVFRSYTLAGKLKVREFVVMPDHFHVLISLDGNTSIERAMQLIKGNYSFRRKKELGFSGEVWQRGFSEVRITDQANYLVRKQYIDENPVRAGLADSAENYPYCSAYLRKKEEGQRLKPTLFLHSYGTTEARALIRSQEVTGLFPIITRSKLFGFRSLRYP